MGEPGALRFAPGRKPTTRPAGVLFHSICRLLAGCCGPKSFNKQRDELEPSCNPGLCVLPMDSLEPSQISVLVQENGHGYKFDKKQNDIAESSESEPRLPGTGHALLQVCVPPRLPERCLAICPCLPRNRRFLTSLGLTSG